MGEATSWLDENQRHLVGALAAVKRRLRAGADADDGEVEAGGDGQAAPALEVLGEAFELSRFERDVLLLSAGPDLDASFAALCAEASGDPGRPYPTFALALAAFPDAHWSALAPTSPLRRWQLVDVGGGTLTTGALRIDERVLHFLTGVNHLDQRLLGYVDPIAPGRVLPASQQRVVDSVGRVWAESPPELVVQLCGRDRAAAGEVAAAACAAVGLGLHRIYAGQVPVQPADLAWFCRLWDREAMLLGSALFVTCEAERTEATEAARRLVDRLRTPVLVGGREPLGDLERPSVRLDVEIPTHSEQRARWLDVVDPSDAGEVDQLVAHFDVGFREIDSATRFARASRVSASGGERLLWNACRVQSRADLDELAQRVEPAVDPVEVVLPEAQRTVLRQLIAQVRHRTRVHHEWGFAAASTRGLGITALFSGPSGAGKTLAAEVIARELELDLYRIDLSAVVSKYIGETETNLRRVFDAAEAGGAVLLFDEADALFGKRSEVKDSHDRYANIEVGYLLQRMEAYRGLAILTTNLQNSLDPAFQRRIRFVVQFPFPDAAARAQIWRTVFPSTTPLDPLDTAWLARLDVTGGSIRNMAINAAFLAADAGQPVGMDHVLAAARTECAKLDKPLPPRWIGGAA